MSFSGIRQNLENIDYAWTKPQTYLVLVPGLSLIVQKIQLANTLPLINNITQQNIAQADAKSRKFANICKWHLRGSMIQITASIIAIKVFAVPLFSLVAILATYELVDTLIKSLRNSITLYEFHPNGIIKSMTSTRACNIF
jgi:hypothetical protein